MSKLHLHQMQNTLCLRWKNEDTRLLPITAGGNECVVMITDKIAMSTYQLKSPVDLITGTRLTYTLLDDGLHPSEILMHRIDIVSTSNVRYAFLSCDHRALFVLSSTFPRGFLDT